MKVEASTPLMDPVPVGEANEERWERNMQIMFVESLKQKARPPRCEPPVTTLAPFGSVAGGALSGVKQTSDPTEPKTKPGSDHPLGPGSSSRAGTLDHLRGAI